MKYFNWLFNGLMLIAIIILYVLHFKSNPNTSSEATKTNSEIPTLVNEDSNGVKTTFRIAHVNTDTILANYTYFQTKRAKLEKQTKDAEAQYQKRLSELEEYYKDLEYKVKLGLATEEQAQTELYKKQSEIEQFRQNLMNHLTQEEQNLTTQLYDSIITQVNRYNKGANYNYILGYTKGGGILYTDKTYDLTDIILKQLNTSK